MSRNFISSSHTLYTESVVMVYKNSLLGSKSKKVVCGFQKMVCLERVK